MKALHWLASARVWLNNLEIAISIFSMALLVAVVGVQVFCRYVLQNSLAWTEEAARYLVIWSVLFGCSYAMRTGSHLELALLRSKVRPHLKTGLEVFSCMACFVFSAIMVYSSMESLLNIHWTRQLTPAMQIPAWLIWIAMPFGFSLMGLQALLRCLDVCLTRSPAETCASINAE